MGGGVVRTDRRWRRRPGKSRATIVPDQDTATAPLSISPVATAEDREAFLRVPWAIYRDDEQWVPPLLAERRDHLDPNKNPFFANAEARFWLARREGAPVGRISAQVNYAHLERHGDATGHFGFLEAEDNPETFRALLGAVEDWLREKGMQRAIGPFSLSINDESGLLVEGFDTPPSVMMGHARPYYGHRIEEAGYRKAKDLICYRYTTDRKNSPMVDSLVKKAGMIDGLVIRHLDMRRYRAEIENIVDVFNDAWADNWGFVPMSDAEIGHMAKMLRLLVRPENFAVAEINGEAVAMAVYLPNLNEAIADLDGRLLPLGWAKLLWRLKVRTPKSGRMPLMGVRKKYQGGIAGAALAFAVIDALQKAQIPKGVQMAELSWILEDNAPVRNVIEQYGGVAYKTYRMYERMLV